MKPIPEKTRGLLLAATALGVLAVTEQADAAERQLISGEQITVVAKDGWCASDIDVTIVSVVPEVHYSGNLVEVQKLLAGLRAVLPLECPQVSSISFTATDGARTPLLEGSITESGGWRLTEVWEVDPSTQVAEAEVEKEQKDFSDEVIPLYKQAETSSPSSEPAAESQDTNTSAPIAPAVDAPEGQPSFAGPAVLPPVKKEEAEQPVVTTQDEATPASDQGDVAQATQQAAETAQGPAEAVAGVSEEQQAHASQQEPAGEETTVAADTSTDDGQFSKITINLLDDEPSAEVQTTEAAEVPAEETYEDALRRLWQEAAVDFGNPEGDMIGLWQSPRACLRDYNTPFITVSVTEQKADSISATLRRETVSDFPKDNDSRSPLGFGYLAHYEGTPQGSSYILHLRDYFGDFPGAEQSRLNSYERNKIANIPLKFVDEVPEDFEASEGNCARTVVRISDDLTLAEKQWQTWKFAGLLNDFSHGHPIRGELIGAKRGSGFTLPQCSDFAQWVGKYDLNDSFIIGNHRVRRLWNDDDFIATWGAAYPELTEEQRWDMVNHAKSCRNQRDANAEIIASMYNWNNPHNDVNRLIADEQALTSIPAHSILFSGSDPKYLFYALNPEIAKELVRARFGQGADASGYLGRLSETHQQEYLRRIEALRAVISDAGIPALAADFPLEETYQRYLLSVLGRIGNHHESEALSEVTEVTGQRVAQFVAPRIDQEIARIDALPDGKPSLERISAIAAEIERELELASEEDAQRFADAVEAKQEAIRNSARHEADEKLQWMTSQIEGMTENISSLESLGKLKASAAALQDATPDLLQEALEAFDTAISEKRQRLLSGALTELDEVRDRFANIPFTREGWEELEDGRKLVERFRNRYATQVWASALEDGGKSEEVAERIEELSSMLVGLEQGIPFAAEDAMLAELKHAGLAGLDQQEVALAETAAFFGKPDEWVADMRARMADSLLDWMNENPKAAVSQMKENDAALRIALSIYGQRNGSAMPEPIREVAEEALRDHLVSAVLARYGVDLNEAVSKEEALPADLASRWLSLVTTAVNTGLPTAHPDLASEVAGQLVEKEREALARVTASNARHLIAGLEEILDKPFDEDFPVDPVGIAIGLVSDKGEIVVGQGRLANPGKRATAVYDADAIPQPQYPDTWTALGHPEVDEAIRAVREDLAERLVRKLKDDESYAELVRSQIREGLEGVSQERAVSQYIHAHEAQSHVTEMVKGTSIAEMIEVVLQSDLDRMYMTICESSWEEAGFSDRDRAKQVLSSGGQPESLGSLACRFALSGARLLQYKGAGTFGDEHELMFETPEGDVLTAILVEAEVRPGQKLLVGKAMKDPLSQWDITASEWRKQVEELVIPVSLIDPEGMMRKES